MRYDVSATRIKIRNMELRHFGSSIIIEEIRVTNCTFYEYYVKFDLLFSVDGVWNTYFDEYCPLWMLSDCQYPETDEEEDLDYLSLFHLAEKAIRKLEKIEIHDMSEENSQMAGQFISRLHIHCKWVSEIVCAGNKLDTVRLSNMCNMLDLLINDAEVFIKNVSAKGE